MGSCWFSIKHCEKRLPLKQRSFGKGVIFHSSIKRLQVFRHEAFFRHLKVHKILCNKGVSFVTLAALMTN